MGRSPRASSRWPPGSRANRRRSCLSTRWRSPLSRPPPAAGNGAYSRIVSIRNFNVDRQPDLVAADSSNPVLLRGHGDGTFGGGVRIPVGYSPRALAVADFNGDARPAVAVANTRS